MSRQSRNSDSGLLGLLRITGPLSMLEMADALEVTPTAIRQRLVRLMDGNAIQRRAILYRIGRPGYRYWLTEDGLLMTRPNFTDVAIRRWEKMHQNSDPSLRRETRRLISGELDAAVRSTVN